MDRRYFSLWCPSWPVVSAWLVLGSRPDSPTVVFDREDNRAHVLAVCPDAYSVGVRRNMRIRSAQAIIPDAYFSVADEVSQTKTFSRVLDVVRDFVPSVSLVRPGRLECDARGPSRYFGGEQSAGLELISRVKNLGIDDIFIGIADTRFAAYVGARMAPYASAGNNVFVVPKGKQETANFLSPQPLSLLDSPAVTSLLERVGLSTLGDVAKIGLADMLARFGGEGERIYSLVSAYEDERDERNISKAVENLSEEYVCEDPLISTEQAGFVAKNLAHRLSQRLIDQGLACEELEIETFLSNGQTVIRTWRVQSSSFEQVIASRVQLQCEEWLNIRARENVEVSFADEVIRESFVRGITKVIVSATQVMSSNRRQVSLFGVDPSLDEDALRAIARVKSLVGDSSVVELKIVGGRMPGESVEFLEYSKNLDDLTSEGFKDSLFESLDESDLSCNLYWPGAVVGKSPMCNFDPPEKAKLLDASNNPIKVHATGLASGDPKYIESKVLKPPRQEIKDFAGPWPLEDRWWDEKKRRRMCRFQITCDSGAYLVVTSGDSAGVAAVY